jgi:MFS family permease
MSESRRDLRREIKLLLVMVAALGVTSGIFETTLNNFLNDTFNITAEQRGALEFPRELPGFLVAVLGGMLFFLSEIRLGTAAACCLACGLAGLAFMGDRSYGAMIAFLVLWSTGNHMLMPVTSTITLSVSPRRMRAGRMGQIGAVNVAAAILGSGLVWVGLQYVDLSYRAMFIIAGACALVAALAVSRMHPLPARAGRRPKLVLKRRYSLYYVLCAFSGARKQVFITFGPWVLIKAFRQPPSTFGLLSIIASVIGVWMLPQLGKWIDRLGERAILMAEALLLVFVCVSYGYAERFAGPAALYVVAATLVLDELLFSVGMARTTYIDKIAETKADLTASLSLSVSLDHAVSMTVPMLGGYLWVRYGYPTVFLAGAVIAVVTLIAASQVRVPRSAEFGPVSPEESGQPQPL